MVQKDAQEKVIFKWNNPKEKCIQYYERLCKTLKNANSEPLLDSLSTS